MATVKPLIQYPDGVEEIRSGDTLPVSPALPAGGEAGQVLIKSSSTDYDTSWGKRFSEGTAAPTGGNDGDVYFQYT